MGKDSESGEEPTEIEEVLCTAGREKSYKLCCLLQRIKRELGGRRKKGVGVVREKS